MDVDSAMKKIVLFLLLLVAGSLRAESLVIYGTELKISSDCALEVKDAKGKQISLKLGLKYTDNCSVINWAETNIPHLERIGRNYLLLIEATRNNSNSCQAEYTAVAILPEGEIKVSEYKKDSGTCGVDRERNVYEYFSKKMKLG